MEFTEENSNPSREEQPASDQAVGADRGKRIANGKAVMALALAGITVLWWALGHTGSKTQESPDDDLQDLQRFMSQYEQRFPDSLSEHEKRQRAVQMMLEDDGEEE